MLPTPVRVLLLLISTANTMTSPPPPEAASSSFEAPPLLLPAIVMVLAAQVHALAFHAPSMWSSRLHQQSCLRLTEHIFYYGLLQIVMIEVLSRWFSLNLHMTACYCSLYYVWSVGERVLSEPASTLSPYGVILSLLMYGGLTLPYLYYYYYYYSHSEDGHLMAWTIADICHYAFTLLLLPPKKA